jgi:hypothetical protein
VTLDIAVGKLFSESNSEDVPTRRMSMGKTKEVLPGGHSISQRNARECLKRASGDMKL